MKRRRLSKSANNRMCVLPFGLKVGCDLSFVILSFFRLCHCVYLCIRLPARAAERSLAFLLCCFCYTAVSVYFLLPYGCNLPRRWLLHQRHMARSNNTGGALQDSTGDSIHRVCSLRDPIKDFKWEFSQRITSPSHFYTV